MKFRYDGPHDAVEIDGLGTVEHGHQLEVSGPIAESLSKQADWTRVDRPRPRKKSDDLSAETEPQDAAEKNEE